MSSIIKALGGSKILKAETEKELKKNISKFLEFKGPTFLEVKIKQGSRNNLGRPTIRPINNKVNFMNFLKD